MAPPDTELTKLQLRENIASVPNIRKRGKVFIGGWVNAALKRQLQATASRETEGNMAQLVERFVVEGLERREKKGPKCRPKRTPSAEGRS